MCKFNLKYCPDIINYIIHLSDIHIRSGNIEKSRYNQYIYTFDNLFIEIGKLSKEVLNETVIIITGDIFHMKNNADSTGIYLFNYLVDNLSKFCPLYIIQGNHDFKQDCPDEPDILTSLFYKNPRHNIEYLSETGLYIANNIIFGLVSVKDTLIKNSTVGKLNNEDLPIFPNPEGVNDQNIKIALFHGTIHEQFAYSISWFNDYDICLLGDIHLQQIHNSKYSNVNNIYEYNIKDKPWGYSGSLIQQSYGEEILNHGFLLWNIKDSTIKPIYIKTNVGFINIDSELNVLNYSGPLNLNDILNNINCPKDLKIRIKDNTTLKFDIDELINDANLIHNKNIIIEKGICPQYNYISTHKYIPTHKYISTHKSLETQETQETQEQYNSIDNWIKYINIMAKDYPNLIDNIDWISWIKNPQKYFIISLLEANKINDSINDKINIRNKKIIQYADKLIELQNISTKKDFNIIKIEWDWLFCYKNNNYIDITGSPKGLIYNINGNNSIGKSSVFDIICITLFGKQIPSRADKSLNNIINCQKPASSIATSSIDIEIDNKIYKINRKYNYKKDIFKTDATIYIKDEIFKTGVNAVNNWIEENIATLDQFLLSSMLTQKTDKDFFSLDNKSQIELFDKALNIDSITIFKNLLQECFNSYDFINKMITTTISVLEQSGNSCNKIMPTYEKEIEELEIKISELSNNTTNIIYDKNYFDYSYEYICENYKDVDYDYIDIKTKATEIIEWRPELNNKIIELEKCQIMAPMAPTPTQMPTPTPIERPKGFKDKYLIHNYCKNKLIKYGEYRANTGKLKSLDFYINYINQPFLFNINRQPQISIKDLKEIYPKYELLEYKTQMEYADIESNVYNIEFILQNINIKLNDYNIKYKQMNIINSRLWPQYNKLNNEMNTINSNIILIDKELKHLDNVPYNPKCAACNSQSWKQRYNELIKNKNELNNNLDLLKIRFNYNLCLIEIHLNNIGHCGHNEINTLIKENNKLTYEMDSLINDLIKTKNKYLYKLDWYNNEYKQYKLHNWYYEQYQLNIIMEYNIIIKTYKYINKYSLYSEYIKYVDYVNITNYINYINLIHSRNTFINTNKYLKTLKTNYWEFHNHWKIKQQLIEANKKLNELKIESAINIKNNEEHANRTKNINMFKEFNDIMNVKINIINDIIAIFNGYRNYLYKDIIIPKLMYEINKLVYDIFDNDCNLNIEIDTNGTLLWYINENNNKSNIKTTGGFREFIYTLAIRIVLNFIGCSTIKCKNLFLDEGFVSASADNLIKIPDFFILLQKYYNYTTIFIVSHLEIIKNCSNINIPIIKTKSLSNVQYKLKTVADIEPPNPNKLLEQKIKAKIAPQNTCNGIKKNGIKCVYKPIKSTLYCKFHTPTAPN